MAALYLLALPAWPQQGIPCGGGTPQNPKTGAFYSNFFNNPTTNYQIPLGTTNAAFAAGDLNATYFSLYYSIANAANSTANPNGCQFELVIAGNFPDTRYFSITVNDMHYTATQHLTDAAIDPIGGPAAYNGNPFVPGNTAPSPAYTGSQAYLVPISLGAVPGNTTTQNPPGTVTPGCQIDPFEGDNLLDATQRHLSNDWNTNMQNPSVNSGLVAHVVDTPSHGAPDTAGSIVVRNYFSPESCPSGPSSCIPSPAPQQPYLMVRDVTTGCAYSAQDVANYLLLPGAPGATACTLKPKDCPSAATALVSMTNPTTPTNTNWLSEHQWVQHIDDANTIPQACYADGDPTLPSPPPFANRVAWTRATQWLGSPGPDDSYIEGAVSKCGSIEHGKHHQRAVPAKVFRGRLRAPVSLPDPDHAGHAVYGPAFHMRAGPRERRNRPEIHEPDVLVSKRQERHRAILRCGPGRHHFRRQHTDGDRQSHGLRLRPVIRGGWPVCDAPRKRGCPPERLAS
jgi:hypothetical protein